MAEFIKYPRVQQKTREELDRVIGFERVTTEQRKRYGCTHQHHYCSLVEPMQTSRLVASTHPRVRLKVRRGGCWHEPEAPGGEEDENKCIDAMEID
ncbi:cytochrome P450 98A2-like [Pyrus ussuriensis x Pyrus communis]|uniref:Cytochrome P450 98A2-like n=1 Tax=Pyrus ussuriensis x Pyrus communis TaxID=2448454 RepID=A0A5N5H711_9ROSA|nr:cytochrome P450 98A2-like [Pyrus ussuriensis x Pyrus communis]